MKEHGRLEACQVVGRISSPNIAFELRYFEVLGERCSHDLGVNRQVTAKLIVWHRKKVVDSFNMLI